MTARAQTVTILFTDLVNSTELLQRAGDDLAQRIFKTHHRLLSEAVAAHGGHEVKWLGDGLMVAFDSARDAVRCAVAMQQASRRPAAGERLEIRAGLNVGEALRDETDYFGSSVVIARRLCDKAQAGQIIASDLVARLLDGRQDHAFDDLGALTLKGIAAPVQAHEVRYKHDPLAMLTVTPFVGRGDEIATLSKKLDEARSGHGFFVMLVGEPGIGKHRRGVLRPSAKYRRYRPLGPLLRRRVGAVLPVRGSNQGVRGQHATRTPFDATRRRRRHSRARPARAPRARARHRGATARAGRGRALPPARGCFQPVHQHRGQADDCTDARRPPLGR